MSLRDLVLAALLLTTGAVAARAQAKPAATLPLQISAFAGGSLSYTGLAHSRNLSLTGGVDVGLRRVFSFDLAVEARGTYPFNSGSAVGQRNLLGGLRVSKRYARVRPYADVLFGRGRQDYINGGYPNPSGTYVYQVTSSNVISPGAGFDVDLLRHAGLKTDLQLQRYSSPVVTSGSVYAKVLTVGIVYRFGF